MRAQWDEERIVLLREAMQGSKTATAALVWADSHNIEIIIDHTVRAGGYYWPGTGVVAVSARQVKTDDYMAQAVNTLTHEIRHAWQDYHGLIYLPEGAQSIHSPLGRDLAIEGLFEADAFAHGKLAQAEYDYNRTQARVVMLQDMQHSDHTHGRAQMLKVFQRAARSEHAASANAPVCLRRYMRDWYGASAMAQSYGQHHRLEYAHALGLGKGGEDYCFEYRPQPGIAQPTPPDFSRRAVLDQLGRSFAKVNYLQDTVMRDHVLRNLLPPGSAERYFPRNQAASKRKPDRLARKIRAAQLRQRLAMPRKGGA